MASLQNFKEAIQMKGFRMFQQALKEFQFIITEIATQETMVQLGENIR